VADPFIAEIRIFPFNFPPKGWAFCNGQIMPITQNTALFSLLGVTYGGDGKSTFGLPNLQGSAPLHFGQGPGLSAYLLGDRGGTQTTTLLESEIPAHTHAARANLLDPADTNVPSPNASFAPSTGGTLYQPAQNATLAPQALTPAGGGLPHTNMQPFLALNFCIALQGIFPPRSP
jgi:microcystin-dependent protein